MHCGEINPQNSETCAHCKTAPKLESSQSLCQSCKTINVCDLACKYCGQSVKAIASIKASQFSTKANEGLAEQAEWLKVYLYQLVSKVEMKITISIVSVLLASFMLFWLVTGQQNGFMLFVYFYFLVIATLILNLCLQLTIGRKLCQQRLSRLKVDPSDKIIIASDMPKALIETILTNRMKEMVSGMTRRHYQKMIPDVIKAYVIWK